MPIILIYLGLVGIVNITTILLLLHIVAKIFNLITFNINSKFIGSAIFESRAA